MTQDNAINVLLVEDLKIAQMAATTALKILNWNIDVAETGLEALNCISKKAYSIIFMDIGLPDELDGFMVTEKIRNSENPNKNTIIVAVTAHDENSYIQKSIDCGMNHFIVKPLTADKIKSILDSYK